MWLFMISLLFERIRKGYFSAVYSGKSDFDQLKGMGSIAYRYYKLFLVRVWLFRYRCMHGILQPILLQKSNLSSYKLWRGNNFYRFVKKIRCSCVFMMNIHLFWNTPEAIWTTDRIFSPLLYPLEHVNRSYLTFSDWFRRCYCFFLFDSINPGRRKFHEKKIIPFVLKKDLVWIGV